MNLKHFGLQNLSESDMEQLLREQLQFEKLQLEMAKQQQQQQQQSKNKTKQKRQYISELFFGLTKSGDVDFKFTLDNESDSNAKYSEYIAMMLNDIVSGNFNDNIVNILVSQSQQDEFKNTVITKVMNHWQEIYKNKPVIKPSQVFRQYMDVK